MKITIILVFFAMSAIAQGQLAGAARGLLEPILLTFGAAFTFIASDKIETDSFSWNEWVTRKFSKSDGVVLFDDSVMTKIKDEETMTKEEKEKEERDVYIKETDQYKEDSKKLFEELAGNKVLTPEYLKKRYGNRDKLDKELMKKYNKEIKEMGKVFGISMVHDDMEA